MIRALEEISHKFDLTIGTFGHAGDGNLHPTILTDKRNQEEWHRVEAAVEAIFEVALELGGAPFRANTASALPNLISWRKSSAKVPFSSLRKLKPRWIRKTY